jgi:hypothetical protein
MRSKRVDDMSKPNPANESFQKKQNPAQTQQPYNKLGQNQQFITDERIKQVIIESLIELNIVPIPQKKKALINV